MNRIRRTARLIWASLIILMGAAPKADAYPLQETWQTWTYLSSDDGTPVTRTVTLAATARDSIITISQVAGDPNNAGVDSLGMAVVMWFEATVTTNVSPGTFYFLGNTRLNNADTLSTTVTDSLVVQAGTHTGDRLRLPRAWKTLFVAGSGGCTLTYGVLTKPKWFQR